MRSLSHLLPNIDLAQAVLVGELLKSLERIEHSLGLEPTCKPCSANCYTFLQSGRGSCFYILRVQISGPLYL
jgi:hypothetical protein